MNNKKIFIAGGLLLVAGFVWYKISSLKKDISGRSGAGTTNTGISGTSTDVENKTIGEIM
jgi:hypothetical protein